MKAAVAFLCAAAVVAAASAADNPLIIAGATLIDGTGLPPVSGAFVAVHDGRISDVSTMVRRRGRMTLAKNVRVISGDDLWIVPGFIDAHVHRNSDAEARAMLRWGITSARWMSEDVAASKAAAAASRRSKTEPEYFPAAPIFTAPGGWWAAEAPDRNLDRFPKTAAEAREAVRRAEALGTREIKIMYDDMSWCRDPLPRLPKMSPDVLRALIGEARARGFRASVHAPRLADAREAVEAGATVLAHGVIDEVIPDEVIGNWKANGIFYVPTLDVFDFLADTKAFLAGTLADANIRASLSNATIARMSSDDYVRTYRNRYPNAAFVAAHLATARENVRRLATAGVRVALGTDMWAFPGAGEHLELDELVRSGLSPMEAIVAATRTAAESLGEGADRGTIEVGKRADFVVLSANPLAAIGNSRQIEAVYKGGELAWSRHSQ